MNTEKRFVDAVEKIYALALSDEAWDAGLNAVADLLGAACVSFEVINKRQQLPAFLRIAGDFDPDLGKPYLEHYSKISPRVQNAPSYKSGDVSYDYQFISEQEIDRSEYYNDFAMRQGHRYFVAGHLLNDDGYMALFAAQRSPKQGHVEKSEVDLVKRFLPHFQQALNLKFRLAENISSLHQYPDSSAEAVIGINTYGKVVFANGMAEKMFSLQDGIECRNGNLSFFDRQQLIVFNKALSSVNFLEGEDIDLSCCDFVLKRPSNKKPYLVSIRPIMESNQFAFMHESRAVALMFIRDPDHFVDLDIEALKQSFNLSQQEGNLAEVLDKGLSLQEVAKSRGVAITTVRTQLYSLMSKVGVSRQSDLIRLLGQYRRPFL